jgi:hypothetical protein
MAFTRLRLIAILALDTASSLFTPESSIGQLQQQRGVVGLPTLRQRTPARRVLARRLGKASSTILS